MEVRSWLRPVGARWNRILINKTTSTIQFQLPSMGGVWKWWLLITSKSTKTTFIEETRSKTFIETRSKTTRMNVTHSKQSKQTIFLFIRKTRSIFFKSGCFSAFLFFYSFTYSIQQRFCRIKRYSKLQFGCLPVKNEDQRSQSATNR